MVLHSGPPISRVEFASRTRIKNGGQRVKSGFNANWDGFAGQFTSPRKPLIAVEMLRLMSLRCFGRSYSQVSALSSSK
jgi:hypothetical protein